LNAAGSVGRALVSISSLDGLAMIREVIFADGGSQDEIAEIAQECGAEIVVSAPGRGGQLQSGVRAATGDWFLFLHADTSLDGGWEAQLSAFMRNHGENKNEGNKAGYFKFALDDDGAKPRLLEWLVALRCGVFALPYGDQALFISRRLYDEVGGFGAMPLMEDVDLVRRLGRKRLQRINLKAVTSADRYRLDGYLRRMFRNLFCISLYLLGVSPERILGVYGR
jgi:rSAM/selenodomain-associated transferase 2